MQAQFPPPKCDCLCPVPQNEVLSADDCGRLAAKLALDKRTSDKLNAQGASCSLQEYTPCCCCSSRAVSCLSPKAAVLHSSRLYTPPPPILFRRMSFVLLAMPFALYPPLLPHFAVEAVSVTSDRANTYLKLAQAAEALGGPKLSPYPEADPAAVPPPSEDAPPPHE